MPIKENDAGEAAGQAAQEQSRLAKQLIDETSGIRGGLIDDAFGFVSGNRDVAGLPEFAAAKSVGEQQFQRARESIIGDTPEGGALTSALADLDVGRAQGFTNLAGALSGSEVDRALQLATFGAAQGSQGLSSAGFLQSQRAQSEAAENAGKGELVGVLGSAIIGK